MSNNEFLTENGANRVVIVAWDGATPLGVGRKQIESNLDFNACGIRALPDGFFDQIPLEKKLDKKILAELDISDNIKDIIMKRYDGVIRERREKFLRQIPNVKACGQVQQGERGNLVPLSDKDLTTMVNELAGKEIPFKHQTTDGKWLNDATRPISQLLRKLERYQKMGYLSAAQLVKGLTDSGFDLTVNSEGSNAAIILGSGIGGVQTYQENTFRISRAMPPKPTFIPNSIVGAVMAINCLTGIRGKTYVLSTACASGLHASYETFLNLRSGYEELDWALSGGIETALTMNSLAGFAKMPALSTRKPDKASIPFAAERDGFVLAEGSITMLFTTLKYAKEKELPILAEVAGGAASQDCYPHPTAPHPDGNGLYLAMRDSLYRSKILIPDVDLVVAHGTSTPLGDPAEAVAIRNLYGTDVRVTSNKGDYGHMIGASGPAGIVTALKAINDGTVCLVPSTKDEIDKNINDLNICTYDGDNSIDARVVQVNAAGFGGQNCSLVIKKYEP
ncbi:MAG: beta-ketoacyl synthase N-terminal-like domain-containing protein [Nanoarchaeota archaeon]|nr:beta-ketoacyl synthase N-terminal-like domain-containing protein [Nanoarchaeota archaeon]